MYEVLSLAFLYPDDGTLERLRNATGALLRDAANADGEGPRASIGRLSGILDAIDREQAENEYVDVFGHTISTDCPPYEAEYGQAHVFQKSQTLAGLNAFYDAFGVAPNPALKERADHISVEMDFMHFLTLKEGYARANGHGADKVDLCRRAQESFLANHLGSWTEAFTQRLAAKSNGSGLYGVLAETLDAFMGSEFNEFELDPDPLAPAADGPPENLLDDSACEVLPQEVGRV
jgi:DMSO reductase family type II enzyme chaperone